TVVERVAGPRAEARVPHERGVERSVEHHRRAPLVPRACSTRSYDPVVLDTNGNRLCVAKAVGRRVAPAARVVVIQPADRIEPQHAPDLGDLVIDAATETRLERARHTASEPECAQVRLQVIVQSTWTRR